MARMSEYGILETHIWGTFSIVVFTLIWGSFRELVSKWPVTQKRLAVVENNLAAFDAMLGLFHSLTAYSVNSA